MWMPEEDEAGREDTARSVLTMDGFGLGLGLEEDLEGFLRASIRERISANCCCSWATLFSRALFSELSGEFWKASGEFWREEEEFRRNWGPGAEELELVGLGNEPNEDVATDEEVLMISGD